MSTNDNPTSATQSPPSSPSSPTPSNNDSNHSDSNDRYSDIDRFHLNENDLKAFTSHIEIKLRTNFSSFDLTKSIASPRRDLLAALTLLSPADNGGLGGGGVLDGKFGNGNDDRLTPGGYVYLLSRCLERFDQPVQLRVVLSLLGLEPDTARLFSLLDKNGDELDELDELDTVEEDGDTNERPTQSQTIDDRFHRTILYFLNTVASNSTMDWVRAISTIVRNKLFFAPNQNPHSTNPITEERIDPLLKRTIEDILDSVTNAAVQAHELSSRADFCIAQKHEQKEEEDEHEHEHDNDDGEDETVRRREQRMDELLDSFGLNLDRNPLYAPYGYSLCNPVLLKRAVPELFPIDSHNDNDTTTTNTNAGAAASAALSV